MVAPTPPQAAVRNIEAVDAARTDTAVARAIDLLRTFGLAPHTPPRVLLVSPSAFADYPVVASLRAFRLQKNGAFDPAIYVVRTDEVYRLAQQGDSRGVVLLASTLLHELVHGDGGNEQAALQAEIRFLRRYIVISGTAASPLMWGVSQLEQRLSAGHGAMRDTLPTQH